MMLMINGEDADPAIPESPGHFPAKFSVKRVRQLEPLKTMAFFELNVFFKPHNRKQKHDTMGLKKLVHYSLRTSI